MSSPSNSTNQIISLLKQLDIISFDDVGNPNESDDTYSPYARQLPPLTFGYTCFAPETRRFEVEEGRVLPTRALGTEDMELVDWNDIDHVQQCMKGSTRALMAELNIGVRVAHSNLRKMSDVNNQPRSGHMHYRQRRCRSVLSRSSPPQ